MKVTFSDWHVRPSTTVMVTVAVLMFGKNKFAGKGDTLLLAKHKAVVGKIGIPKMWLTSN